MSKKKNTEPDGNHQALTRRVEQIENKVGRFLSQEADAYLRTLSESSKETTNSIKYCLETAQTLEALSKRLEETMAGLGLQLEEMRKLTRTERALDKNLRNLKKCTSSLSLQVEEVEKLTKTEKALDKNVQNLKKYTSSLSRTINKLKRKKPSFLERIKSMISKI